MTAHIWKAAHHPRIQLSFRRAHNARFIATDSRNRLSKCWAPTGGISPQDGEQDDSHALLLRGGFLRQAHSGVFHLLPLGLRVQNKLEGLIDKYMHSISASKVSLSSITTEALWRQSGRYSANSELLRINDRKESGFLLSPTHEEEITALVASMVHSYKDLPLRLYQVGRKYRDERRPRQGLLRAKEFMMKDLYTFDHSPQDALKTYEAVRQAYNNIFNDLKLPYLVADADSGNMGGKLSHEYHFVSQKGEDNVWSCNSCEYVANEELVEKKTALPSGARSPEENSRYIFRGISVDRKTEIQIQIGRPSSASGEEHVSWNRVSEFVNLHAVKKALPDNVELDTGIEASTLTELLDNTDKRGMVLLRDRACFGELEDPSVPDLTITKPGDACSRCSTGHLDVQKAIEVGHTFHLGTRYSEPLNAMIAVPDKSTKEAMQMGCHGIGVSRIIGAVASLLSDEKGLNWPRVIAPYEAVILTSPQTNEGEALDVYDALCGTQSKAQGTVDGKAYVDLVLDDRPIKSLGWKLRDADLIGYPVIVVLGRGWKERKEVEVQCRRLGVKKEVGLGDLRSMVVEMLDQL
ncbi:prolyl-tRNA synthetase [Cucurbitaria berberidis CBS 394.84]|uniref:proline--tRNA ligase n=1 Tax=Cucurbitaria berberidis CBS 394.84 TaxID=1168544 RepID=A0A9P4G8T2_9PLEO|nr:prolyl-tRNA synthetase [Cucurbitaria berberidis CBS 394.84]KAF1840987.1 prolyl-tRNA synthetase [Cucurbitaria berberidis CBS 394.84]